jgi:hypothetical protein
MSTITKAGVGDKVSFELKRAPNPPEKKTVIEKIKKKLKQVYGYICQLIDGDDDDEDDDDEIDYDLLHKRFITEPFFIYRNR